MLKRKIVQLAELPFRMLKDFSEKPRERVRLKDNIALSDSEYAVATALCDVMAALVKAAKVELPGGIFWGAVETQEGAHALHLRKNRKEIDLSMLLLNRFRDFPTIVYEYPDLTPEPDFWVMRYISLCKGLPQKWHIKIPARFGEIGWKVNGCPVNRHISFLQERINVQYFFGMEKALSSSNSRILEIGGGSGEMAHAICSAVPGVTYYDCDLAQSLIYNAIHMAIWFPKKKHYIYVGDVPVQGVDEKYILRSAEEAAKIKDAVVNIPHFLLKDFHGKMSINLALNAWSFSEMPASEVEKYGHFIKDNLALGGMLVEQNGTHAKLGGCNAKEILNEIFPVRRSTDALFSGLAGSREMGGVSDAWSLAPLPVDTSLDYSSLDNNISAKMLEYKLEQYDLLQNVLK